MVLRLRRNLALIEVTAGDQAVPRVHLSGEQRVQKRGVR